MIFLSHTHKDKPIVEQIAIRLRDTFGQDQVFYDSWSIQPGDGIIDKMNEGLANLKLFLFFVSKNSLQSNLVKLEWQNAVMKASSGHAKIIPVKLDDCLMPPILMQSLYINLFGQGLEVALRQIVDVVSGKNTFSPDSQIFSNLRAYLYKENEITFVECHAEHFMEPISHFLFLVDPAVNKADVTFQCVSESSFRDGFNVGLKLNDGNIYNALFLAIDKATVPGFPFKISVTGNGQKEIAIRGVMHEKKRNEWRIIPLSLSKPAV